ncbi:MAG TPA: histidine kinase, partial [Gammaproteobacteria bacterium]|nr:histidine kinase [Gammaproteobacteria bacterium]
MSRAETAAMKTQRAREQDSIEGIDNDFLPNFCSVRMVFAVIVIAELLAFVITMLSPGVIDNPWGNLGLISMLVQWVALASAALLCLARSLLSRMGSSTAALASYLLVLLVTAVVSEMAFWLMIESTLFPALTSDDHPVFLLRNLAISTVVAAVVLRYLYIQYQWRQRLQSEARARIEALQARIRPHFLFNSMNTIAALTRSDPEAAEAAIEDLSDLFRASLSGTGEQATLDDEIELAHRYLDIEKLRLGDRLRVAWQLEDLPMDARLPPLVLQPLLENAIYHGIEPLPRGGTIQVCGRCVDELVEITVSNPMPDAAAGSRQQGNRIAQQNISQRLAIAFGARAGLR